MIGRKPALMILAVVLVVVVLLGGTANLRGRADGGAFPTLTPTITPTLTPLPIITQFATATTTPTATFSLFTPPPTSIYPVPDINQQAVPTAESLGTEDSISLADRLRQLCIPVSLVMVVVALVAGIVWALRNRR
ncbi:MAG TPA: hypothetical protein VLS48_02160 [Anaerolineales bacterium]|nr:hypothetical protein [Anaerolineales bacterium]